MNDRRFDLLVLFGIFSPITLAQVRLIEEARRHAEAVLVVVGSPDAPRDPRNPWSFEERREMILDATGRPDGLIVEPLRDLLYDDQAWAGSATALVEHIAPAGARIGLVGAGEGGTGYYPSLFPRWPSLALPYERGISGAEARRVWFLTSDWRGELGKLVAPTTVRTMAEFARTPVYDELLAQEKFVANYPAVYGRGPHFTADSMCLRDGRILLVERGGDFGKGLLALPGGFADPGESSLSTATRELREEAGADLGEDDVARALVAVGIFDDPHRDLRAHISSNVHVFDLDRIDAGRHAFVAGDDASSLAWHRVEDLDPGRMFADHYHVVHRMLRPEGYPLARVVRPGEVPVEVARLCSEHARARQGIATEAGSPSP